MLKELFESNLYLTYPKRDNRALMLNEFNMNGYFPLLDDSACGGCHFICNASLADREQLKVHANCSVHVISVNQIFSFVKESVGERCDYLIESSNSSILIEMTCATSEFVVDKRQKARRQLSNTIVLLFANQAIKNHINKHNCRYVVFSWKETFDPNTPKDSVEKTMADMMLMTDSVYSPDNEMDFDYGYKIKEIRYPYVLEVE